MRQNVFPEIESFIFKEDLLSHEDIALKTAAEHLHFVIRQHNIFCNNESDEVDTFSMGIWKEIEKMFIYKDKKKHLPVPVYLFVKPSHNIKFLLHIF